MDNTLFRTSLLIIGICGISGVLVDIDHFISYYFIPEWSGRFLHTPILFTCCVVLCGLITYLGGLLLGSILTGGLK